MASETHSPQRRNTTSIIGIALLLIPIITWALWIYTFNINPSASQSEKVRIFTSYFPGFLRSLSSISLTVLVAAAASIYFSVVGRKKANTIFKVLGIVAIILAALILLLQLFTML